MTGMKATTIKRALIAVYDKSRITDFARALNEEFGVELLSTGGTARHLRDAGLPVTLVEEVTGFPEMMDGRVKTLHPKVHAGILADRDKPDHLEQLRAQGIEPIDMVVVNLYPFEETVARPDCTVSEAIEMIDIGGPCMLRAAAKNHRHVVVVPHEDAYGAILEELRASGDVAETSRQGLAFATFSMTADYDAQIQEYLDGILEVEMDATDIAEKEGIVNPWFDPEADRLEIVVDRHSETNYGENPSQSATVWLSAHEEFRECNLLTGVDGGNTLIHGAMSFNNYVDGDSALALVKDLTQAELEGRHAVAFIKHTNACGCAIGDDPEEVYRQAYLGDPIAAAGGVLCMNFPVTREIAEMVMQSYARWGKEAGAAFFKLDVWIAPSFEPEAVTLITTPTEKRKWGASCRLLAVGNLTTSVDPLEVDMKKIAGGLLVQERDLVGLNEAAWQVVTTREPTEEELKDLRFALLVCKHTKSNAITICRGGRLLGNGAGQMSRVKSCDLSIQLARENGHGDALAGAVAAGDAFFPVEDGPQKLIDAGITAIIQPGGSVRDNDTVTVCDRAGVAMIVTGTRHFKH